MLINLIFSSIISIVLFNIRKKQLNIDMNKIIDYENYYTNRKKIKQYYFILNIIGNVLVLILVLFFNSYLSIFSYVTNYLMLLSLVVLFAPTLIMLIWRIKNVQYNI